MSSPEEKRKELDRYRIKQAEESLDEARYLLSGGKSFRSFMKSGYYAMFYSVLALLIYETYSSSKHSGVLGYFNKRSYQAVQRLDKGGPPQRQSDSRCYLVFKSCCWDQGICGEDQKTAAQD